MSHNRHKNLTLEVRKNKSTTIYRISQDKDANHMHTELYTLILLTVLDSMARPLQGLNGKRFDLKATFWGRNHGEMYKSVKVEIEAR